VFPSSFSVSSIKHARTHGQHTRSVPPGSAKAYGREPKTCLGRVFHYKSDHFEDVYETQVCRSTLTSVVVNSAQVSSC